MDRVTTIQRIIDHIHGRTYLEIGVAGGDTFLQVNARRKIAVDPSLSAKRMAKIRLFRPIRANLFSRCFRMTSDDFFRRRADWLAKHPPDVVFIDGLHTFDQSLKDVTNSLECLSRGGIIVMHDCNPPSEAAAFPASSYEHAEASRPSGWTGQWCGEVWKTIVHLRSAREMVRVVVLACDYGLGIVARGKPDSRLSYTREEIAGLT